MLLLLLCGVTWLSPAHADAKVAPFRILAPGAFHGWEVKSEESGEVWLGLFREGTGWVLQAAVIEVRPSVDPYLDRGSARTGALVFVPGAGPEPAPEDWDFARCPEAAEAAGQPVFLLQPLDGFVEGPRTALSISSADIVPGMVIPLDGDTRLVTSSRALYLEADGRRQCLGELYTDSVGEGIRLVWAGDLDSDGRVDLLLDDRAHYAFRRGYRLFLSGTASPKALVREVAAFSTTSC